MNIHEPLPVLRELPVRLTSFREWASRQRWSA